MAEHAAPRRRSSRRRDRVRALLSLGLVLGLGAVGTFAFWTDEVVVSGSTFTTATLDLQVNNSDAYATTTLGMGAMVPGSTSAQVLTVQNKGTAPLKYTMTGGLTGTDAALFAPASPPRHLTLSIRRDGSRSGTGSTATCTGGEEVYTGSLTTVTTTAIIAARRPATPLAATATEVLCFQVSFSGTAPTTLQGKSAAATFTVRGTTDVS